MELFPTSGPLHLLIPLSENSVPRSAPGRFLGSGLFMSTIPDHSPQTGFQPQHLQSQSPCCVSLIIYLLQHVYLWKVSHLFTSCLFLPKWKFHEGKKLLCFISSVNLLPDRKMFTKSLLRGSVTGADCLGSSVNSVQETLVVIMKGPSQVFAAWKTQKSKNPSSFWRYGELFG